MLKVVLIVFTGIKRKESTVDDIKSISNIKSATQVVCYLVAVPVAWLAGRVCTVLPTK